MGKRNNTRVAGPGRGRRGRFALIEMPIVCSDSHCDQICPFCIDEKYWCTLFSVSLVSEVPKGRKRKRMVRPKCCVQSESSAELFSYLKRSARMGEGL